MGVSRILPASIRSRSSISPIIRFRRCASLLMSVARPLTSSAPMVSSRRISLKPWMPTSAVRNSWLTIDTNSLLSSFRRSRPARLAIAVSSASCLAVMSSNMARK